MSGQGSFNTWNRFGRSSLPVSRAGPGSSYTRRNNRRTSAWSSFGRSSTAGPGSAAPNPWKNYNRFGRSSTAAGPGSAAPNARGNNRTRRVNRCNRNNTKPKYINITRNISQARDYERAGCAFTNGDTMLTGYQHRRIGLMYDGLGGKKDEDDRTAKQPICWLRAKL